MRFITVFRFILFPFSFLYGVITAIRNKLYDLNVLKSTNFELPLITVGNLSVGGTGKTPQIEYLIRLLKSDFKIAVLSRGYKRKSEGFVLANKNSTVLDLGDEPFQYHQKFKEVQVAVHGDRVEGVQNIMNEKPETKVVLLDDAYQHRKIKAGYQILLTSYDKLFYQDFMMPIGSLRELRSGKKRADSIVITKCPYDLSVKDQQNIKEKIQPTKNQKVYFTTINYSNNLLGSSVLELDELNKEKFILVTGIAKPKPLIDYLNTKELSFEHLKYPDHHHFTDKELKILQEKNKNTKIITTEKDYMRLQAHINDLYYLPIEVQFLNNKETFDNEVLSFVSDF